MTHKKDSQFSKYCLNRFQFVFAPKLGEQNDLLNKTENTIYAFLPTSGQICFPIIWAFYTILPVTKSKDKIIKKPKYFCLRIQS